MADPDENNDELDPTLTPDGDAAPEPDAEEAAIEARARRMGWAPLENWRGDKSKWMPAQQFVDRAESEVPIMRERYRAMDGRLERTEAQLREANTKLAETGQVLVQLRDWARSADDRAYARAKRDLEAAQRQAVAAADTERFDALEREKTVLEEGRRAAVIPPADATPAPKAPPAAAPSPTDPAVDAWVRENASWFYTDQEMKDFAISQFGILENTRRDLSVEDRLAMVKDRLVMIYPDKFPDSSPRQRPRERPSPVNEPTPAPAGRSGSKAFSYADLPADAKKQCDKFVKTIPNYTREEYVKEWLRQEGAA
jgi:hypothetical protein